MLDRKTTTRQFAEPMCQPPLIWYADIPWEAGWSSRHRLLAGLAQRGRRVVYSSETRWLWERNTEIWRRSRSYGRVERVGDLLVDHPGKLFARTRRLPTWDSFTLRRHARRIRAALGVVKGGRFGAIVSHPTFWPYVETLNPCHLVYFVFDAYCLTPDWNDEMAHFEARLVERADLIVGCSREMLDYLPEKGATERRVLSHGVDLAQFMEAENSSAPPDLAQVPRPRIGYVGRINSKIDIGLVMALAKREPDQQWVFVGPVTEDPRATSDFNTAWPRLLQLANVHYLGAKPHTDVPRYLHRMDVNVMCYRTEGGWWSAGYPLKMHEYLAVGRPIVSANLSTIRPFAHAIDIAHTPGEWTAAIERALNRGGVATREERQAIARQNSWDSRVDQLDTWLRGIAVSSDGVNLRD